MAAYGDDSRTRLVVHRHCSLKCSLPTIAAYQESKRVVSTPSLLSLAGTARLHPSSRMVLTSNMSAPHMPHVMADVRGSGVGLNGMWDPAHRDRSGLNKRDDAGLRPEPSK